MNEAMAAIAEMAEKLGAENPDVRIAGHLTVGSPRRSIPYIKVLDTMIYHVQAVPEGVEAVHIDRGTVWGNPVRLTPGIDRAKAIELYRRWLWREIKGGRIDVAALASLHGKALACWCAPAPCHGEVLARAAAWAAGRIRKPGEGGSA